MCNNLKAKGKLRELEATKSRLLFQYMVRIPGLQLYFAIISSIHWIDLSVCLVVDLRVKYMIMVSRTSNQLSRIASQLQSLTGDVIVYSKCIHMSSRLNQARRSRYIPFLAANLLFTLQKRDLAPYIPRSILLILLLSSQQDYRFILIAVKHQNMTYRNTRKTSNDKRTNQSNFMLLIMRL